VHGKSARNREYGCETAMPDSVVKTNRKAQNYSAEVLMGSMRTKVKPLFRYPLGTCNILAMWILRMPAKVWKIAERVARKVFATIRYRFSHLDNGLKLEESVWPSWAFDMDA
jgi:hypothetical protein